MCPMTVSRIIRQTFHFLCHFFFLPILRGRTLELINKRARCACANNPPLSIFDSDLRGGLEVDTASGSGMSLSGSCDAAGDILGSGIFHNAV